jgi:hypothetical protein
MNQFKIPCGKQATKFKIPSGNAFAQRLVEKGEQNSKLKTANHKGWGFYLP